MLYESDGTHKTVRCEKSKQTFPVSIATQLAPSLLRVLLVGSQEEDFFLIREILVRNWNALPAELDHAGSLEEAKTMLQSGDYGLVLFEHETVDAAATKLLSEFLQTRGAMPFILLTEHADEKAVAEIIQAGAYDCMERSQLNGANLVRTITRLEIVTFGKDFANITVAFERDIAGQVTRGRQSQTWTRLPEGWRIVFAHVSMLV